MVTIFTPTYNRINLLPRLYDSLKNQTDKNFEWLIVDDGSSDGTKDLITQWKSENIVSITYIYQQNSGKPAATNNGVINARGDLFFCVDSDDYISEKAVEIINDSRDKLEKENIAGILALKADTQNNLLSKNMPNDLEYSNAYDLLEIFGGSGELSIVYKTKVLQQYLFPIIDGEKFITECVVYDKIDLDYVMLLVDRVLTICEYQEDGLTSNIVNTMLKNPTGYKIYHAQRIDLAKSFKTRLAHIIKYNTFKKLSRDNKYNYCGKHKLSVRLLSPIGYVGVLYYKTK